MNSNYMAIIIRILTHPDPESSVKLGYFFYADVCACTVLVMGALCD